MAPTIAGLLAQPRPPADPVELYLAALPVTNASFSTLRAADAQAWTAFFASLPGTVAQLTASARALEDEVKVANTQLDTATQRAKSAAAVTRKAAADLETANRALVRAKQRSGGAASVDTQREEARVERARDAQADAVSAEQTLLERVGQLERLRLEKESALQETRTALQRATARIGPPQLGAIANRVLKIGTQIVVVKNHTDASDVIGVAECEGQTPIILLAPRPTQPISNAAMMFFREHEMAHHVLGHIDCSTGQTARTGGQEQELQADCEAAKTLSNFQDGERVVDIMFGHFWTWNQGASTTHPSSRTRAAALYRECQ